jgi:hypothetical protein
MSYTLQIGSAEPVELEALGVRDAVLREDMQGGADLRLVVGAELSATALGSPFSKCILWDGEFPRFIGWLDGWSRGAAGNEATVEYVIAGPMRWLERANFVQGRAGLAILAGAAGDGAPGDPQAWNVSLGEIVQKAWDGGGDGEFLYDEFSPAFEHETPTNFRADVSCREALATLLTFAPGAVVRWDWVEPETGVWKPLLKVEALAGSATRNLSLSVMDLSRAGLNPRFDLLAEEVEVFYLRGNEVAGSDTAASAGDAATYGSGRKIIATYDTNALNSVPADGVAAVLAAWHQRLHVDGAVTREGIDWNERCGDVLGFDGMTVPELADRTTALHTLTRDLLAERTEMQLGVMPGRAIFKVKDYDGGRSPVSGAFNAQLATPAIRGVLDEGDEDPVDLGSIFGSAAFRKVYRCDGYFAWVLMTPWSEVPE